MDKIKKIGGRYSLQCCSKNWIKEPFKEVAERPFNTSKKVEVNTDRSASVSSLFGSCVSLSQSINFPPNEKIYCLPVLRLSGVFHYGNAFPYLLCLSHFLTNLIHYPVYFEVILITRFFVKKKVVFITYQIFTNLRKHLDILNIRYLQCFQILI